MTQSRDETFRQMQTGHPKKLTGTDAARLLGVTRQRVSQLFAKWKKKNGRVNVPSLPQSVVPVPDPSPVHPVNPPEKDPLAGVFNEPTPELPPVAAPSDLKGVLNPVGLPTDPPSQDVPPVPPTPPPPAEPQVDPEDASAGRELLRYARRLITEASARWFGVKENDPKFASLKEENEFLRVSLKRNADKAAPLGWLTKGWKGLLIGAGIEILRVALMTPPAPPVTKSRDVTPPAPGPNLRPLPPVPAVAPTAEPDEDAAESDENDEPRRKYTLDEKIALAKKKQGD